jgi:hypothetical protein
MMSTAEGQTKLQWPVRLRRWVGERCGAVAVSRFLHTTFGIHEVEK